MRRTLFILFALVLCGFTPADSLGMLVIPSIDLSQPVYPVGRIQVQGGESYQVLPNDVGWHNDTARPGEVGNTVLNGHHKLGAGVFGGLPDVTIGASLTLAGRSYIVTNKVILNEAGATLVGHLPCLCIFFSDFSMMGVRRRTRRM